VDLRPSLVAESRGTVLLNLAYVPCLPEQTGYSSKRVDFILPRTGRADPDVCFRPELAETGPLVLVGCLIALISRRHAYDALFKAVARPRYVTLGTLYLFTVGPFLNHQYRVFRPLIGYSCEAVCIGIVLAYVVSRPASLPGRFLNLRLVRHIGVISYSLYLWQQMFTGPETARAGGFPINLGVILGCAELSYWVIERPSIRWRMKFEGNRTPAPADSDFTPVQLSDRASI
jgi:peptidoglycan/LPS O-acetylase OafA/YrhL